MQLCKVSLLVSVLLLFAYLLNWLTFMVNYGCYFVHNILIQHSELAFAQTDSLIDSRETTIEITC